MFKKKFYNRVLYEINENFSLEKEWKRSQISELQGNIREAYLKKLKKEEHINHKLKYLELERIRLNEELGTYYTSLSSFNIAYGISIFSAMIILIIQTVLKPFNEVNTNYNILIITIFAVAVYIYSKFFVNRDCPKGFILNLSLKVIDNLERELNKDIVMLSEVVTTKDENTRLNANKESKETYNKKSNYSLLRLLKNNHSNKYKSADCDEGLILLSTNSEKEDYKTVNNLYGKIKKYYLERLNKNEIDIRVEKVRLEGKAGKLDNNIKSYSVNYLNNFMIIIITLYLEGSKLFDYNLNWFSNSILNNVLTVFSKGIIFMGIAYFLPKLVFNKKTKKEREEEILNNFKLRVVEDLIKDIDSGKIALDEAATTKDEE